MAREQAAWHAENIKAELRKKFGTMRAFAELHGISPQIVAETIRSPNGSARVETIIATAIEVERHKLWPERWTADGRKIDRSQFRKARRLAKAAA